MKVTIEMIDRLLELRREAGCEALLEANQAGKFAYVAREDGSLLTVDVTWPVAQLIVETLNLLPDLLRTHRDLLEFRSATVELLERHQIATQIIVEHKPARKPDDGA